MRSRGWSARIARALLLGFVLATVLLAAAAWELFVRAPGLERIDFALLGHEWRLLAPQALGLLAFVPLLWLTPLLPLSDPPWAQRARALVLRTALLSLLALALSRPALLDSRQEMAVVILADVSDSMPDEALAQAQSFIDETYRLAGAATPVHVISFAAEPRELGGEGGGGAGHGAGSSTGTGTSTGTSTGTGTSTDTSTSTDTGTSTDTSTSTSTDTSTSTGTGTSASGGGGAPRVTRHAGEQSTDIESALKMAYGLLPGDRLKRVVILSDGQQNEGDLLAEAGNAARFGVKIFDRTFDVTLPPEVLVADLQLPPVIEVGSPFSLRAVLHSTAPAEATLVLWQDDFREGTPQRAALAPGVNEIDLPATVREPGFKRFRLEVQASPSQDHSAGNNTFTQVAVVKGRPRLLLLDGEPQQARYLEQALRKQQIDVELRGPRGMPTTLQELESFDLLLLSDVPATFLDNGQMELIGTYLRELGGGFIMTGGENSLGLGGYFRTPLEDLLPVRLDVEKKRETPSLGMVLLIDKSGSMADDKIELAKEAAKAVVELLDPEDRVAIIAFDAAPEVLVRLQAARNRLRILELISRLRSGGGTSILPGLQAAHDQLDSSDAQIRHVILLTDGQSPRQGVLEMATEMAAAGITLSTVAVGDEADRPLLSALADTGGGRSYFAASMHAVPRIFTKETQTVSRNALVEEPFHPVADRRFQVLRGIPLAQAPFLLGYVSTRAKKGAELLLSTEKREPLLARWKVGLGTSMVWTSDIKNRWSVEWLRWRHFPRFWAQLVRDTMRQRTDLGFALRASVEQGQGHIVLDAVDERDRFVNGMQTRVQVDGPKGFRHELTLEQTAAGRYEARLALPHFGSYLLKATHLREGRAVGTTLGGLANPYPAELLHYGVQRELLHQAAQRTGGLDEVTPAQVLEARGEQVRFTRELALQLILAALGLYLLDLFLRRVRLGRAREITFPGRQVDGRIGLPATGCEPRAALEPGARSPEPA